MIHLPWTCRDESELVTIRRADIPRLSTLNANYTARQMLEMYDEVVAQGATQVVMVVSKYKVRK